jgi:DNA-binding MarR family transcriptional regulator
MATAIGAQRKRSPADEAWELLLRLMMVERLRFRAVAAELDLHPAQSGALAHMEPDTPMPMHELAASLHCDNSNVTGLVDRLEARGLVSRRPYEHDRRVTHIVLTPLGIEAREQVRTRMRAAPQAFSRLSRADQRMLRDVLRRALGTTDAA